MFQITTLSKLGAGFTRECSHAPSFASKIRRSWITSAILRSSIIEDSGWRQLQIEENRRPRLIGQAETFSLMFCLKIDFKHPDSSLFTVFWRVYPPANHTVPPKFLRLKFSELVLRGRV